MKLINLKQHSLPYVALLLFFTASFCSCKKVDTNQTENVVERFLTVPANASPQVKRIIQDLEKKNEAQPFIEAFVAKQGYPRWEYVKIKKVKQKNNVLARDDEEAEEIVEVPVVLNDTKFVNAILNIKLEEDEILYKLFEGKNWELYGFDKDANRTRPNANDIVGKIMDYEKLIWGEDIFKVSDNKLFDYWPAGDSKPAAFYIRRKTTVDGIIIITVISDCLKPIGDGQLHGVAPGENIPSGYYWGTCTTTWVIQEDDPWDPFGSGANDASSNLAAWSNGGGGGGGNPSGTQNQPCDPDFKWIRMEVRNNQLFNPCLQEVVSIDPTDLRITSSSSEPQTGLTNDNPDNQWWEDNTLDFPAQPLPSWANMDANFPKKPDGTEKCAQDVFNEIGGQVQAQGGENACALRMSIALNKSGVIIPDVPGQTYAGADGKYYFLSAAKLYNFMLKTFKIPPNPANSRLSFSGSQGGVDGRNFGSLLSGKKGIYLMRPNYPGANYFGATGHASMYNGTNGVANNCDPNHLSDGTYFNAEGGVNNITLWQLN